MSGGYFDYKQFDISRIADDIEEKLKNQGKEKDREDLQWYSEEYLLKYPEDRFHVSYSEEVQEVFKEAVRQLRIAEIYVTRIDWYLSGDDSDEGMIRRLNKDLKGLENK